MCTRRVSIVFLAISLLASACSIKPNNTQTTVLNELPLVVGNARPAGVLAASVRLPKETFPLDAKPSGNHEVDDDIALARLPPAIPDRASLDATLKSLWQTPNTELRSDSAADKLVPPAIREKVAAAIVSPVLTFKPVIQANGPAPMTADEILARAEQFLGIPYRWGGNSTAGLDCSAYVSLLWGVSRQTTDTLYRVARPITKAELLPGDALNLTIAQDPRRYGHVRLFHAWANVEQTRMWVYEETEPRSMHRVIAYDDRYTPMRRINYLPSGSSAPAPMLVSTLLKLPPANAITAFLSLPRSAAHVELPLLRDVASPSQARVRPVRDTAPTASEPPSSAQQGPATIPARTGPVRAPRRNPEPTRKETPIRQEPPSPTPAAKPVSPTDQSRADNRPKQAPPAPVRTPAPPEPKAAPKPTNNRPAQPKTDDRPAQRTDPPTLKVEPPSLIDPPATSAPKATPTPAPAQDGKDRRQDKDRPEPQPSVVRDAPAPAATRPAPASEPKAAAEPKDAKDRPSQDKEAPRDQNRGQDQDKSKQQQGSAARGGDGKKGK